MRTKEEQMEQAITDAEDIRVKLMNGKMPIIETNELLDLLIHINKEYKEGVENMYVYLLLDDEINHRSIRLCETEEQAKRIVDEGISYGYRKVKLLTDSDVDEIIDEWKCCHGG